MSPPASRNFAKGPGLALRRIVRAWRRAARRLRGQSGASRGALNRLEAEGMALRGESVERALECFDAVLAREPNRITTLRPAGRLLMKAARYEEARPYWERLAR